MHSEDRKLLSEELKLSAKKSALLKYAICRHIELFKNNRQLKSINNIHVIYFFLQIRPLLFPSHFIFLLELINEAFRNLYLNEISILSVATELAGKICTEICRTPCIISWSNYFSCFTDFTSMCGR